MYFTLVIVLEQAKICREALKDLVCRLEVKPIQRSPGSDHPETLKEMLLNLWLVNHRILTQSENLLARRREGDLNPKGLGHGLKPF